MLLTAVVPCVCCLLRRALVELECGENNRLLEVSEPATCEYALRLATPCACDEALASATAAAAGVDGG